MNPPDINFYLVLILGFVVYVIWGFLLHFVLSHPYLKTDKEIKKLEISQIQKKIDNIKPELNQIEGSITIIESNISNCNSIIQQKEIEIIGYEKGIIPLNIDLLRGSIGEFMGGWQQFTHGYFDENNAEDKINEADKCKDEWLNNKLESLNLNIKSTN